MTHIEPCSIKINLNLRVFGRKPNGYHELHTLFWRRPSPEVLTVRFAEGEKSPDKLSVYGAAIPGENLVMRVIEGLRTQDVIAHAFPPLDIALYKFLPMGSGVGAGSGNAAAIFKWAQRMGVSLDVKNSADYGADVAFLAGSAGLAYAEGVGEELTAVNEELELPGMIVFPKWFSSTGRAYSLLDDFRKTAGGETTLAEARAESQNLLNKLLKSEKAGLLPNDFLPILSSRHLEYEAFFNDAESLGALAWGLCGSGSALFVLFADREPLFSLQRFLTGAEWIEKIWMLR